jgi:hypothetical protein
VNIRLAESEKMDIVSAFAIDPTDGIPLMSAALQVRMQNLNRKGTLLPVFGGF